MLTAYAGYFNSFSLVSIDVVNGCFSFVNIKKLSLNTMESA
jgi:general stress protein CsbA